MSSAVVRTGFLKEPRSRVNSVQTFPELLVSGGFLKRRVYGPGIAERTPRSSHQRVRKPQGSEFRNRHVDRKRCDMSAEAPTDRANPNRPEHASRHLPGGCCQAFCSCASTLGIWLVLCRFI